MKYKYHILLLGMSLVLIGCYLFISGKYSKLGSEIMFIGGLLEFTFAGLFLKEKFSK